MSISCIIPSIGRRTLEFTVASILQNLRPDEGDELIVVGARKPDIIKPKYDIRDDFKYVYYDNITPKPIIGYPSGAEERDLGRSIALGTHIFVCDDDDLILPDAFAYIRNKLTTIDPLSILIFRMQYGCQKQWMSPFTKDLKAGHWRGFEEHQYVLFGPPLLEIGNVGSAMCLFPNNEFLGKWDCSAPGGIKNVNEDFWIVKNYVDKSKIRPIFDPTIIGIIRPTPKEIASIIGIDPPLDLIYTAQPQWDGKP